jgi:hypothetical protein
MENSLNEMETGELLTRQEGDDIGVTGAAQQLAASDSGSSALHLSLAQ